MILRLVLCQISIDFMGVHVTFFMDWSCSISECLLIAAKHIYPCVFALVTCNSCFHRVVQTTWNL